MVWATRLLPDGERAAEQRFGLGSIAKLTGDPSQFLKSASRRGVLRPLNPLPDFQRSPDQRFGLLIFALHAQRRRQTLKR